MMWWNEVFVVAACRFWRAFWGVRRGRVELGVELGRGMREEGRAENPPRSLMDDRTTEAQRSSRRTTWGRHRRLPSFGTCTASGRSRTDQRVVGKELRTHERQALQKMRRINTCMQRGREIMHTHLDNSLIPLTANKYRIHSQHCRCANHPCAWGATEKERNRN